VSTDYVIRRGDTLWGIAQRRNLAVDALSLVNQNINPNRLREGQVIKVPQKITWRLVQGRQEYDYSTMMNDLSRLERVYPFIRLPSAGNSVLGRRIPEVLVGNGAKRVHYNGSFHANEWITTPVIMTFLNDYLLALTNRNPIRGLSMQRYYGGLALGRADGEPGWSQSRAEWTAP
jgi:g-D-glutamyl-meso-diaminopimelate peptidase